MLLHVCIVCGGICFMKQSQSFSDWNSEQYTKFGTQRTQPIIDLLNRIQKESPEKILDIGCGPGNSTAMLSRFFPDADILGIDASESMLNHALEKHPELSFRKCNVPEDLSSLSDSYDLVFSNACIHWIPDQKKLLHNILEMMPDGGILAVQIPLTQEAKFYHVLNQVLEQPKWKTLRSIHNFYNLLPGEYYDLFSSERCTFTLWETTYYHVMDSIDEIIEWYKGSGLRPYLNALRDEQRKDFLSDLLSQLKQYYKSQQDGKVIHKMPRLFFTVKKNGIEG